MFSIGHKMSTCRHFTNTGVLFVRRLFRANWATVAAGFMALSMQSCGSKQACETSSVSSSAPSAVASKGLKPIATAIVQLLANPDRFDDSDVAVGGYLYVEASGEVDASLHLSPDDALRGLGNGISVTFRRCSDGDGSSLSEDEFREHSRRFVKVYGKFSASKHSAIVPGVICSVNKIIDLQEPPETLLKRVCPKDGGESICAEHSRSTAK